MRKLIPSQIPQNHSELLIEKNLVAKKIRQWLRLREIPVELHEIKAHQLYKKRVDTKLDGTRDKDWEDAREYLKNHPQDILFWQLKKFFIKPFQYTGEALKQLINFFWKILPASDWGKILATPLILSVATALITNHFQEQSKLNDTVSKYFDKIEKYIIEEKIDTSEIDTPAKILIKGESLFTLRSIDKKREEVLSFFSKNTDIIRRESLLSFLSEFGLLDHNKDGISLGYFNLSEINLSGFKLIGIDLNNTLLSRANLKGANLDHANLKSAILRSANLGVANLSHADLSHADLRGALLNSAALFCSNLFHSDLSNSDLSEAGLNEAKLIKS